MKVLYFTKYTRKGASSRLRSYQYFPYLEQQGIQITVSPLFCDTYLDNLYSGKSTKLQLIKGYLSRFLMLFKVSRFNKIVIEKELFPYFPAVFEWLFSVLEVNYIVDYDDAIFHNYDLLSNPFIRFFLKRKIDCVMRYSHTVIAGNDYLGNRAKEANTKNIQLLPTVVDLNRYTIKTHSDTSQVVIGWIGTQSTFKYLKSIKDVLKQLIDEYDVLIHIVGAKDSLGLGKNEIHIDWSEETESDSILQFDIGIMPLSNTPWEKGKCAYKLIQYMACGIPVVASAIGMNNQVVQKDTGLLIDDNKNWIFFMKLYITQLELRQRHGLNARKLIEEKYCIKKTAPVIIKRLKNDF